jgi:hypothetical protein
VLDTLTEKNFHEAFQKWRWWDRRLHAGGNYFAGDGGWQALWRVLWMLQRQFGIFWIPPHKQFGWPSNFIHEERIPHYPPHRRLQGPMAA